jgi:hypothetical protein
VRDLAEFRQDLPWEKRLDLIRRTFATAPMMGLSQNEDAEAAWKKAFDRDVHLMGRIYRDVIKQDQAIPGRPGPRPALNGPKAQPMVDEWFGRDPAGRPYSLLPFADALKVLMKGKSVHQMAEKVGVAQSQMYRLVTGEREPTGDTMEKVATACGKSPSYFLEYRISTITSAIIYKLARNPDRTIAAYEALYFAR